MCGQKILWPAPSHRLKYTKTDARENGKWLQRRKCEDPHNPKGQASLPCGYLCLWAQARPFFLVHENGKWTNPDLFNTIRQFSQQGKGNNFPRGEHVREEVFDI